MTTFRGFLREIDRAQRRSERESARAHKAYLKEQTVVLAHDAVERHEEYIAFLTTPHKDCSKKIDWLKIKSEEAPSAPQLKHCNEKVAQDKLDTYKPSFIDKIFKLQERQKRKLSAKIFKAKEQDNKIYQSEILKYNEELEEWKESQAFAEGILSYNHETHIKCFKKFFDKECLTNLSETLKLSVDDKGIFVTLKIRPIDQVVPEERLSLTSTGKLSKRSMPTSRRNEIYQDYVCSTLLRVSREIAAIYTAEKFIVHAVDNLVNPATGHLEEQALLSVVISVQTLDSINFDAIDASSCMKNFKHNMRFKKTTGFEAVEKLV